MTDATTETTRDARLDSPELNQAAFEFNKATKAVDTLLSKLSQRGLKRVLKNVLVFPLESIDLKDNNERELFIHAIHALGAKRVMMDTFKPTEEELNEQVVEPLVNEIRQATNQEEVTDGRTE